MSEVNSIAFDFSNEEEKKYYYKILEDFIEFSRASNDTYIDIHTKHEDVNIVVLDFVQLPYDKSYGGQFTYVDEDHMVMKQVMLPDNSYEYAIDEEHEKAIIENWEKEHNEYSEEE